MSSSKSCIWMAMILRPTMVLRPRLGQIIAPEKCHTSPPGVTEVSRAVSCPCGSVGSFAVVGRFHGGGVDLVSVSLETPGDVPERLRQLMIFLFRECLLAIQNQTAMQFLR